MELTFVPRLVVARGMGGTPILRGRRARVVHCVDFDPYSAGGCKESGFYVMPNFFLLPLRSCDAAV
jgi:hypothetical protein